MAEVKRLHIYADVNTRQCIFMMKDVFGLLSSKPEVEIGMLNDKVSDCPYKEDEFCRDVGDVVHGIDVSDLPPFYQG